MLSSPWTCLVDIGANLTDSAFRSDLPAVVARAAEAGVAQILVTGTSVTESIRAADLASTSAGRLFATAGLHPHNARHWTSDCAEQLRVLVQKDCVVALGETGLDFNRDFSPRPDQEQAFEAQLELAASLAMPVFVHERDTNGRVAQILAHHRDQLCGAVVHCFTGTAEDLRAYLNLDLYVGITGWICDERRGQTLRELVHQIPLQRLLVETDAPYLLPRDLQPRPKNRRNEPATLPHIVTALARCLNIKAERVAKHTAVNARTLFRLPEPGAE